MREESTEAVVQLCVGLWLASAPLWLIGVVWASNHYHLGPLSDALPSGIGIWVLSAAFFAGIGCLLDLYLHARWEKHIDERD